MAEEKEVFLAVATALFQGVLQNNSLVQFSRLMKASTDQQQTARNIAFILSLEQYQENRQRSVWQWERDQTFLEEMYRNDNIQGLWKEFFRVSKDTFTTLCYLFKLRLQKQLIHL